MFKVKSKMRLFRLVVGLSFVIPMIVSLAPSVITRLFGAHCGNALVDQDTPSRNVVSATTEYQHLWDYDTDFIPQNGLKTLDQQVIFSDGDCDRVVALDLETGDEFWSAHISRPRQIAVDNSQNISYIFGSQNEQLIAINNAGTKLWTNNTLRGQRVGISPYTFSDGRLFAYSYSLGFVPVDPDTGAFGSAIELPDVGGQFSYIGDDYLWLITSNNSLQAREIETPFEVEWTSPYTGFSECCLDQVESSSSVILAYFHSSLFALDRENGGLLWTFQDSDIVSNIAISNERVAFLDENAQLHLLDLMTGNSLARIQFTLPDIEARNNSDSGGVIGGSQIEYQDDVVAIYFGDTDYLSAYQIMLDN
ncbi:MAG: PQQ-binding-like beta-propeller repeat protein [Aggregatilineales bacterium]